MSATLELTEALIACHSVTPADGGCQELIAKRLQAIGFHTESVISGPDHFQVTNLWAIKKGKAGDQGKLLMFAGHTDVVPTGPLEKWASNPFAPRNPMGRYWSKDHPSHRPRLAPYTQY